MADNYSQMSIAFPVTEAEGDWLKQAWSAMSTADYAGVEPTPPPEGLSLEELEWPPCAMEIEEKGEGLRAWMYSEESVDAENLANVLQLFLKHFDSDRGIGIEAAQTCSKPRIGEFGGFAAWVTKDSIEWMDTGSWLSRKEHEHGKVTCDGCPAVSEVGWGDTEFCLDCQRKADPSLVCEDHQLTHVAGEPCPVCRVELRARAAEFDQQAIAGMQERAERERAEQALNARIDELHGPGAAAALEEAIADGSIFGELRAEEEDEHRVVLGRCPAHGVTGLCPEDGIAYLDPGEIDVDVEHIMTDEGCKILINGQGHLPCTEHVHYIHKLNAYTFLGRRGECGETHPVLSAAEDWEPVTCPRCLQVKANAETESSA